MSDEIGWCGWEGVVCWRGRQENCVKPKKKERKHIKLCWGGNEGLAGAAERRKKLFPLDSQLKNGTGVGDFDRPQLPCLWMDFVPVLGAGAQDLEE